MPKRSSNGDDFQNALRVVEQATGEPLAKNAAAVALGRLGGLKGGKARAKKLSGEQRKAIAVKAAKTRWKKAKKAAKIEAGAELSS
jgi:hypothetical protein